MGGQHGSAHAKDWTHEISLTHSITHTLLDTFKAENRSLHIDHDSRFQCHQNKTKHSPDFLTNQNEQNIKCSVIANINLQELKESTKCELIQIGNQQIIWNHALVVVDTPFCHSHLTPFAFYCIASPSHVSRARL